MRLSNSLIMKRLTIANDLLNEKLFNSKFLLYFIIFLKVIKIYV